ncbi:MAG: XdhC family protein [Candidatus Sabulitectum sp.]|nr:XdhC family protein [Candidatus Sabulitectum sp.]
MIDLDLFLNSRPLRSVLCIVAEISGSCPGKVGFKMIVPPDGACTGSVGGGSMEFQVIRKARQMLLSCEEKPCVVSFDHSATAEPQTSSGMICSGRQKIVLIPSTSFKYELEGKQGLQVTMNGLNLLKYSPDDPGLRTDGNSWEYTEKIAPPLTVYIFGGGHCGLALTLILNTLDLRVVLIDDREHVWTMEENKTAWKKIVRDYADVSSLVPDGDGALVVIMTASHTGDSVVLRQMLPLDLRYLGMMGSRTTAKHILAEMQSLGFTEKELGSVHTPIGISISSQTPAEIAVSIAAEIIMVLNKR